MIHNYSIGYEKNECLTIFNNTGRWVRLITVEPLQVIEPVEYRRFRAGTMIVLSYTTAFALSDVSWSWAREHDAISSSLLSLLALLFVCGIPYTGLLRLLK